MKNHETIQRLADGGLKVRVAHIREISGVEAEKLAKQTPGWRLHGKLPRQQPTAATVVRIVKIEEGETEDVIAEGVSLCSATDQFDRKLGLTIALGRALKSVGGLAPKEAEGAATA